MTSNSLPAPDRDDDFEQLPADLQSFEADLRELRPRSFKSIQSTPRVFAAVTSTSLSNRMMFTAGALTGCLLGAIVTFLVFERTRFSLPMVSNSSPTSLAENQSTEDAIPQVRDESTDAPPSMEWRQGIADFFFGSLDRNDRSISSSKIAPLLSAASYSDGSQLLNDYSFVGFDKVEDGPPARKTLGELQQELLRAF